MKKFKIKVGNNLDLLKNIPDNSIDACITDPPYGLSFMNKKWDYEVPSVEVWKEVLRVLKPGGHLLSFGGTRTYHRLVVNIEDAGFEIRDQIQWIYGSGFPKSLNIGKAVDKLLGNEREVVGVKENYLDTNNRKKGDTSMYDSAWGDNKEVDLEITKGNTEYEGQGTGLKPANEPICLARKPISEKNIAENVIKWKTGGLNIDKSRIGTTDKLGRPQSQEQNSEIKLGLKNNEYNGYSDDEVGGRFPANIIFDEEAAELLGNPSRFFYVAKVSKTERNLGLDGFEEKENKMTNMYFDKEDGTPRKGGVQKNTHPTVKPINLMNYLCNLITPEGGIILDPFLGSGSTGISALLNGYRFIGMEMDADYVKIAESRIENYEKYRDLLKE